MRPPKKERKWAASVLRAKAGVCTSTMAVPKKIAQKAEHAQGENGGQQPAATAELHKQITELGLQKAARQRHHLLKQLLQSAKKARTFLVADCFAAKEAPAALKNQ